MSQVKVVVLTLTFSTLSIMRDLEAEARLRGADHGAVAEQDAALGLVDRVPASQNGGERDQADDGRGDNSPGHVFLLGDFNAA